MTIERFRECYDIEGLEAWFLDVVRQYEKWAKSQMGWTFGVYWCFKDFLKTSE